MLATTGDRFNDAHSYTRSTLVDEVASEKKAIVAAERVRRAMAQQLVGEGQLRDLYNQIDENGDGQVQFIELKNALHRMGLSMLVADASDVMRQMDTNNDGKISYDEFEAFLQHDQMESRLKILHEREVSREFQPPILRKSSLQGGKVYRDATYKPLPNKWGTYGNGKRMTAVRRTSYALGGTTRYTIMAGENNAHYDDNREQLRQGLQEKLLSGGLATIFANVDKKRTGKISKQAFMGELDRMGWSVLYQDGKDILASIESDRSGLVSFQQLKKIAVRHYK